VPRGSIVGETDSHTTQVTLLKFGSARTAVGEALEIWWSRTEREPNTENVEPS